jgi:hypothetical protein
MATTILNLPPYSEINTRRAYFAVETVSKQNLNDIKTQSFSLDSLLHILDKDITNRVDSDDIKEGSLNKYLTDTNLASMGIIQSINNRLLTLEESPVTVSSLETPLPDSSYNYSLNIINGEYTFEGVDSLIFNQEDFSVTFNNNNEALISISKDIDAETFNNAPPSFYLDLSNHTGILPNPINNNLTPYSLFTHTVNSIEKDISNKLNYQYFPSVEVCSSESIDFTNVPTIIDGVELQTGSAILLIAQSNPILNGVWVYIEGNLSRPSFFSNSLISDNYLVFVRNGNTYHDTIWKTYTDRGALIVGVNPLEFKLFLTRTNSRTLVVNEGELGVKIEEGSGLISTDNGIQLESYGIEGSYGTDNKVPTIKVNNKGIITEINEREIVANKALVSASIHGIEHSKSLTYYGKDKAGSIGFHALYSIPKSSYTITTPEYTITDGNLVDIYILSTDSKEVLIDIDKEISREFKLISQSEGVSVWIKDRERVIDLKKGDICVMVYEKELGWGYTINTFTLI